MNLSSVALNFFVGGTVTALIVQLEESGMRTWSGVAALAPVFTLISYLFIGNSRGALAVSQHSKFVLIGTLVSWIPYMTAVAILAPRIGANRAIGTGLVIFFILATGFVATVEKLGLFQ